MTRLLRHNGELIVREVEAQFFLIDEEDGNIHHLNETASAIWRLLEGSATSNTIIQTFSFVYPEENVGHLKQSTRSLLRDLVRRGVLVRVKRRGAG